MEKLRHEFEAIGFYLSAHPLDSFGSTLKRLDVVSYGDLPGWIAGRPTMRAKLAGIVTGPPGADLRQGLALRLRPALRRQRHV